MAFVKLDCGILQSTLWVDSDARIMFITALLMAQPHEIREPTPQLKIRSLDETGWAVPPGWYGFVKAASVGIARTAGVDREAAMDALERMGQPEPDSRSREFDGRRLVRVNGGFIVLNWEKYRERDQTAAIRSKRWREKQAKKITPDTRDDDSDTRDEASRMRNDTEAEERREKQKREAEGTETDLSAVPTSDLPISLKPEWEVFYGWEKLTDTKTRSEAVRTKIVNRIKARLKDRCTVDQLLGCVEFAKRDEFYREKGYAKNPEVLWKDAARVESLCQRLGQLQAGGGAAKTMTTMEAQREASRLFLADEEDL